MLQFAAPAHGRLWHEPDLPRCLLSGSYRGISRRTADMLESTRLTEADIVPPLTARETCYSPMAGVLILTWY